MFGHSYTGHSEWCDDNNGFEVIEDFVDFSKRESFINLVFTEIVSTNDKVLYNC